ncbi:UNVERIFIED_CONTAM: Retrovirus-related Pol polyprotein from transposon TNT 1-94 [Sesamum radiatum]|uniref:Retrovirus-related Pol polyprotein from transposon TNT 1-94 n=1 Tax=Sesamum radiatum TaxID=300843 RepID=A0AAW2UAG1_SESRA
MEQPEGFIVPGLERKVCKLRKSLYGLKQAPKQCACLKKNKGDSVSQADYAKIIGSVMFLMNYTRPDIAYAVSRLSRYTHNPNKDHWDALRRLLRYLKVVMFSLWVGERYLGNLPNKHVLLVLPMESEFIALELAGQEAEWLRNLVGDVPLWGSSVPVSLHCDSQAAIGIAKNYAYNGKRRHIRIRHGGEGTSKRWDNFLGVCEIREKFGRSPYKGLTRRIILETSRAMGLKPLE